MRNARQSGVKLENGWIKRRQEQGLYNNLVKEVRLEDERVQRNDAHGVTLRLNFS